jgi:diguanylate cyclase (GGDEF)-like protein
MKVIHKVMILILLMLVALIVVGNLIFSTFFNRYLLKQESDQTQVLVSSAISYFDEKKSKYASSAMDWGTWDATYNFVIDGNEKYIEDNISSDAFNTLDISFLVIAGKNSTMLTQYYYDQQRATFRPFPKELKDGITAHFYMYTGRDSTSSVAKMGDQYFIIATSEITDSAQEKEPNGVLIMGREIDEAMLFNIGQVTGSTMRLERPYQIDGDVLQPLLDKMGNLQTSYISQIDKTNNLIKGHILLSVNKGAAPVVVGFEKDRDIFAFGAVQQRSFWFIYSAFICGMILMLILIGSRIYGKSIGLLIREISKLDLEREPDKKLPNNTQDELSVLRISVNKMLDKICAEQDKLRKSEKRLLIAQEIAHVGNWEFGLKEDRIWYSEEARKIMGVEQDSPYMVFEDIEKILGHEEFLRMQDETTRMLELRNCIVMELRISRLNDGMERIIRWQAEPDCDESGNVEKIMGVIVDITPEKLKEADIIYLSHHDTLTGLYNRFFLEEEMKRLQAERQLPLSIIIGDINGLKLINDAFGHAEGDKLLIDTAKILNSCSRSEDIVARTGGDEFWIILPQTPESVAKKICRRIYEACDEFNIDTGRELAFASISLGCGTKSNQEQSMDTVIREAEEAMYKHKLLERKSMHSSIMSSIKATMEEKSYETQEHGERLVKLSRRIGRALDLSDDQFNDLELLAMLHDIGKIGVDSAILSKEGPLTEDEWAEIKKHPEIGYRIAAVSPELNSISEYILCHHERWDGKGYPQGLSRTQIPLLSRIISVVDSFDAMTQDRSYRKAMPLDDAVIEIIQHAGSQFDPEIVDLFIRHALVNEKLTLEHPNKILRASRIIGPDMAEL